MARNTRSTKADRADKFTWQKGDVEIYATIEEARAAAKKREAALQKKLAAAKKAAKKK